jgi:membrane protease YdiL (CAAX protease family)
LAQTIFDAIVHAVGLVEQFVVDAVSALGSFLYELLGAACVVLGPLVMLWGAYHLWRVFQKHKPRRWFEWPSFAFVSIALGMLIFTLGYAMTFPETFTRTVMVTHEHVWQTSKWFFFQEVHREKIQQPKIEYTSTYRKWVFLRNTSCRLLLVGLSIVLVEICARLRIRAISR